VLFAPSQLLLCKGAHCYAGKGASGKKRKKGGGGKTHKEDLTEIKKPIPVPPAPAPAPDGKSSISNQAPLPHVSDHAARHSDSQDTDRCSASLSPTVDQEDASMETSTIKPLATSAGSKSVLLVLTDSVTVASTDAAEASSRLQTLADVASLGKPPYDQEVKDAAHGSSSSHSLVAPGTGMQLMPSLLVPPACASLITALAYAGREARNEGQAGFLADLADNVGRLQLHPVDTCAVPVISSGANRIDVEPSLSSTAALANTVALECQQVESTAKEDGDNVDDVMPAAGTSVVSDADDEAGRSDSISTTDAASPVHKSECLRCG
jgi:hypothetical protein